MKIVLDARFLFRGGVHPHSRLVHVLLRQNSEVAYDARLVLYTDRLESQAFLEAEYQAPNVEVKVVGPSGGRWHRLYWLSKSLPKALRRDGADVFYSSFYFLPPRISGVRLYNTIHDCCVFYIDPKLNRGLFTRRAYLYVLKRVMRWTCQRADATITVSRFSQSMLSRHLGLPNRATRVCYHGLDPASSNLTGELPPAGEPEHSEPYFLFVGTNLPKKNIRQCLTGFAQLPETIRQFYKLRLKTSCYPEDRALIDKLAIGDRVEFIDRRLDEAGMAALFGGASLLLLLSYDEGFGLPIIEAFAAGVPVLVSDRAACGEIVTLSECKADPDNTEEIAQKWLSLVVDLELRRRCLEEQGRLLPRFVCRASADTFYKTIAE